MPVTVGAPSVSFRETITAPFECNYRYVKQTGGKGQFAHTVIRFEPNPGGGFEFVDITKGGVIPKEYIPSVQKGLAAAMNKGPFAGYPVPILLAEVNRIWAWFSMIRISCFVSFSRSQK